MHEHLMHTAYLVHPLHPHRTARRAMQSLFWLHRLEGTAALRLQYNTTSCLPFLKINSPASSPSLTPWNNASEPSRSRMKRTLPWFFIPTNLESRRADDHYRIRRTSPRRQDLMRGIGRDDSCRCRPASTGVERVHHDHRY